MAKKTSKLSPAPKPQSQPQAPASVAVKYGEQKPENNTNKK